MANTILAVETSCDETAAAVYTTHILSNIIFSQTAIHAPFGGVIPELASRSHIEKISPVVQESLRKAKLTLPDIDVFAVTNKPGLPGSLLIGTCYTKALAWVFKKPIIGIDHLEGHIFSSFLDNNVPFPHVCLTTSGGHTSLYLVTNFGEFTLLGTTLDDAAGEAFDKVAKVMGLAYPGGPLIEKLAEQAQFIDFFSYPRGTKKTLDFSFSGLKTAVLYDLVKKGFYDLSEKKLTQEIPQHTKEQIASSLLVCIKDIFIEKLKLALIKHPSVKAITFVGGVACNKYLRNAITTFAHNHACSFFYPRPEYCTDNAAMIAFVASYKAQQRLYNNYSLDIFS